MYNLIDILQAEKISNNCIGVAKLQQANVAGVVEEDLDSMQKVGGIQDIAEALDKDLEKGIFPGLEQDLCSQRISNTLSPTQAPALVSMLRDGKLILEGDESEKGSVALDNVSPSDTREAVISERHRWYEIVLKLKEQIHML
ncbi:hypothetical protein CFP56_010797 [Quercus suber]|uniref:Uncharacterized protein n=1 Tax=Quercus suber TaxID=58331 RepID=A0AAW0KY58_QUESU